MGKNSGNLGRAMIKSRMTKQHLSKSNWIHTSDLNDGADWSKTNFQSVTEQNSLDEFLTTAELAGTDFEAERLNINFVSKPKVGILSVEEKEKIKNVQDQHRSFLRIPRRPLWKENTDLTSEEFKLKERDTFLEWRKNFVQLQDVDGISMTPFEKNLEFWKQLWRVIERSDVIVQIVDARNPLLFRCEDLEAYAKEVDTNKINLILINKSDLLTTKQRIEWFKYFEKINCKVVFWSAFYANEANAAAAKLAGNENREINNNHRHQEDLIEEEEEEDEESTQEEEENEEDEEESSTEVEEELVKEVSSLKTDENVEESPIDPYEEKCKILTREELIKLFKTIHTNLEKIKPGSTTIGMVGYPNVGKSSTINALMQAKRVAVSETPGKTKHYQTLFIDDELLLCDCPGLVFPSFVATKGELILNGVLPVDHMRDYVEPINQLCHQIPVHVLEIIYGIMLPKPNEGEDPNRPPTAEEFCSVYSYSHGYMNHRGTPDVQRGARIIIKDYINGKLIYAYPPPGINEKSFQEFRIDPAKEAKYFEKCKKNIQKAENKPELTAFDSEFFRKLEPRVLSKGPVVASYNRINKEGMTASQSVETINSMGKSSKKHFKGNKREKLRRITSHLDA